MNKNDELILEKQYYTKQDIVSLLKLTDKTVLNNLYKLADKICGENFSDKNQKCGIISISNYCVNNCLYCRIRRSNEKISRFRLFQKQILQLCQKAEKNKYKCVLLQSGEDCDFEFNSLIEVVQDIVSSTKLEVFLSTGEKTELEFKTLKNAGVSGYILKHTTSDPMLFRQLHPELKYSNGIKCLRTIKNQRLLTGSGIIVGLPGQTFESIANDILLFKELDIDIIDIGPYLPYTNTPLAKKFEQAGGYFAPAVGYFDINEMLFKIIAISRIINKKAMIPFTPNFNAINFENGSEIALKSGANLVLEDMVSPKYVQFYKSHI
jgi:biotin synthase